MPGVSDFLSGDRKTGTAWFWLGARLRRLRPGDRVGGLVGIPQLVALRTEQLEQVFHRYAADRQRNLGDVDRLDDQADVLRGQEDRIRRGYDRNIRLQVIGAESERIFLSQRASPGVGQGGRDLDHIVGSGGKRAPHVHGLSGPALPEN